jgi:threonine synthase
MRRDLFAVSVTDEETRKTIDEAYRKYNLLLEPHGAIAWKGMKDYSVQDKGTKPGKPLCISLETAHPAKFPAELEQILNFKPLLPSSLESLEHLAENYVSMDNNYDLLKNFILKFY